MIKSFIADKFIFFSLESSIHSKKYWRPYGLSEFNITHKDCKNAIYYNLLAEDYLNDFIKHNLVFEKKKNNPIFISSNFSKIKYVQNFLGKQFSDLSFFGLFGNKVENISNNYHLNAQNLIGEHKSAICIENSEEIGYIQASFLPALMSGTVPIIKASKYILKNILIPDCYIELNDYRVMTDKQKNIEIDKCSNYILSNKEIFTNLANEYLVFIKQMNLVEIDFSIKESQKFKKKIFEL